MSSLYQACCYRREEGEGDRWREREIDGGRVAEKRGRRENRGKREREMKLI